MNYLQFNALIFLMIASAFVSMAQMPYVRNLDLPESAKTLVKNKICDWDYFKNTVPAFDSTGRHIAWEYADIISGDFNDNGQTDYALLARGVDSLSQQQGYLVVLFRTDSSFLVQVVDSLQYVSDWVLFLHRKGQVLYDFEDETCFSLPVDGIFLYFYEKAGSTYYYQKGQFRRIHSSD